MSSVTIGRDLQSWRWGHPEAESGSVAGVRRRLAARTSGEVVAGTDLLFLSIAVAAFAPAVLQWPVAVFVLGVLGVCALRGQYASRITLNVSKDIGTLAAAVAVPLTVIGAFDGFGRQVRPFVLVGLSPTCVPALIGRAFAYVGIRRARTKGALGQRVYRGCRAGGGTLRRDSRAVPELRAAPDRALGRLRRRLPLAPGSGRDRSARPRPAGSPDRPGGDRLRV